MRLKLTLLTLLWFGICQAQTEDELNQISAHLSQATITQGAFQQQKQLKFLRNPLNSNGTFVYHQSKGVIWKTLSPVPSTVIINDNRLLTDQGEQAVPAAFGKVFQALLGNNLNFLTEGFTIAVSHHDAVWQLQLEPKEPLLKKLFLHIKLSGDQELRQMELEEFNGNQTQIHFEHITHPSELASEQEVDFARLSP